MKWFDVFHNTTIFSRWYVKFIPKELPKPMGRWKTDYCNVKINNKIDLSNEDHCGPCGQYVITKRNLHQQNTIVKNKKSE